MVRLTHGLVQRLWRLRLLLAALVTATLLLGAVLKDEMQLTSTRPAWVAEGNCTPRTNVAFLKSHKCASSAIQNILFRYGDKHNLHFALPAAGNYFGGGRKSFTADMVRLLPLNKFESNIFAVHTKWNHDEVKKVMPEDTAYFTIVREPTAVFQSLYVFAKMEERNDLSLEKYVREVPVDVERHNGFLGYNQMTWDFGMPAESMNNLTAVRELVARADKDFGLVLVAERMEESLVLLAKYLCWELSDVLVLRLNTLRDEFKTPLTAEARQILQQKLAPDYLLYRHFLARFEQQVKAFGQREMAASVARLRELMALLVDTCSFVKMEATKLKDQYRPWSDRVDGFVGDGGSGCSVYTLAELRFIDALRKKQNKEVIKKFGSQPGPPLDAIPLGMTQDGKVSEQDMENLKKLLIHKNNTATKGGKMKEVKKAAVEQYKTPSVNAAA